MSLPSRVRVVRQSNLLEPSMRERVIALAAAQGCDSREQLGAPGVRVALALAGSTLIGFAFASNCELTAVLVREWRSRGIEEALKLSLEREG